MTSSNAYYYTKVMSELFLQTPTDGRVSFQSIGSMADFWVVSTSLAWHGDPWESQLDLDIEFPLDVLPGAFSKGFCCHKLWPATSNSYDIICMQNIHWFKIQFIPLSAVDRILAILSSVCAQYSPFHRNLPERQAGHKINCCDMMLAAQIRSTGPERDQVTYSRFPCARNGFESHSPMS